MSVALWLLFYLGVTFLIGRLYSSFLGWNAVRKVFYPGVIVAALGRQLACVVTGHKAAEVDTARKDGPTGAQAPQGTAVFRAFFALAPFFAAVVTFLVIDRLLDHPIAFSRKLPRLALEQDAGLKILDVTVDFLKGYASAIGGHEIGSWKLWVYLYASFSLIVGTAPSADDAKAVAVALLGAGLFLMLIAFVGFELAGGVSGGLWVAFSSFVALAIFVLVASALLFLPIKFLRDSRKEGK